MFRPLQDNWDAIDGTMPQSAEDEAVRYKVGVRWSVDSCAIDCVLMLLVWTRAWRLVADQLSMDEVSYLQEAASTARQLVAMEEWGIMATRVRSRLRNTIRHELHQANPVCFPANAYWDITQVLYALADQVPQFSCHIGIYLFCCDGNKRMGSAANVKRILGLPQVNDHQPLRTVLNEYFTPGPDILNEHVPYHEVASSIEACTRGLQCIRERSIQRIVLDRLPPILIVPTIECDQRLATRLELFTGFTFDYMDRVGTQQAAYEPRGVVFMIERNHYVIRWKCLLAREEVREYDGMNGENCTRTDNWWQDLNVINTKVCIMIYTKVEGENT
jgi:hypothetical protein